MKNGILVRVGIDSTYGRWNSPVNSETGEFVYVPIPQKGNTQIRRPFTELTDTLDNFGTPLPGHLADQAMHLDPDFDYLTYGDAGARGARIATLDQGDMIVFYAGLRDIHPAPQLVYAIIGLFVIDRIVKARDLEPGQRHVNAHTRVELGPDSTDLIFFGQPGKSGRTQRAIPIGSRRPANNNPDGLPMYRVTPDLLEEWGGLSVNDGYIHRSATPPLFTDIGKFMAWFDKQQVALILKNN